MAKDYRCIIEINSASASLTGVVFDNGIVGRTFYKSYRHDGIKNNFFKNPEKLYFIIKKLVEEYTDSLGRAVQSAYAVLPQKLFRFKQNKHSVNVESGVVNKFDVEDLINKSFAEIEDCETLSCTPIAFRAKEDYIDNPIGQECSELELISVSEGLLVRVIEFFTDISKRLGIDFEYISKMAPVLSKLQKKIELRRSPRIVVNFDSDYIEVCYCEMCSVIAEKIIEVGNEHFIGLLSEVGKCNREIAEELFRHVNFNVCEGNYIVGGSTPMVFDVKTVNANLSKLYEYVAAEIDKAITDLTESGAYPIYLFGETACSVRGAARLIANRLQMGVNVLFADSLLWNKPSDYGIVGLIEDICNKQ